MKPFVAIMEATPDNRVAKYMDFNTQNEARAHVDVHIDKYPLAFFHDSPTDNFMHWSVNMNAKTITSLPDTVALTSQVEQAIRAEGAQRLQAFMEDFTFDIATSIHLLFVRASGAVWTTSEQNMANELALKFTYVSDLHIAVKQAIVGISSMTNTKKINFDATTGVPWPVEPQ